MMDLLNLRLNKLVEVVINNDSRETDYRYSGKILTELESGLAMEVGSSFLLSIVGL